MEGFLKLKSSVKEVASHPYFLPLLLVLIGVAFYFWTTASPRLQRSVGSQLQQASPYASRIASPNASQYAGGDESQNSSQDQNSSQASSTGQVPADSTNQSQERQTASTESVPTTTVVLFYTDWCGHCQNFKPTWHEMMNKYQGHPNVNLDEINCGENKEIAKQYQIEGYPTIIKFSGQSQPQVYEGNRSPADLDKFINSN